MSDAPIISARGIVNRFGSHQVHDGIALNVREGEVLGIAGGSGSGKSVLLKTLTGLHQPTEGEVRLDGKPVAEVEGAERAALLGVLFQQGALFSSLTVAGNIALPLELHKKMEPEERAKVAGEKLKLTGLKPEDGAKFPAELSGGMVKRAALARALALDPRILFLDEPTAGLDPTSADGIDELIQQLNNELGITVVMITHDPVTLFTTCDRAAMLVDGNLTVDTVEGLSNSDQPWIHDFLHGPRAQGARAANEPNKTKSRRRHGVR